MIFDIKTLVKKGKIKRKKNARMVQMKSTVTVIYVWDNHYAPWRIVNLRSIKKLPRSFNFKKIYAQMRIYYSKLKSSGCDSFSIAVRWTKEVL